ncbi:MAG: hypothetical protein ACXAC2_06855 [Candidatus Kariarchaeaceae archaeon]|jgi:YHS domain-containing protein
MKVLFYGDNLKNSINLSKNQDKPKPITACGTEVTNKNISANFQNKILYFCEKECLEEFSANPDEFIKSDHCLISLTTLPSDKPA